jgi:hypothetical protein
VATGSLQLVSTLTVTPFSGSPQAGSDLTFQNVVQQTLQATSQSQYQLTSATPQAVNFGGLAQATVVQVVCDASLIEVEITTMDGATQIIPIDAGGKFEWACLSLPITAITLIGQAMQTINVYVFLGTA